MVRGYQDACFTRRIEKVAGPLQGSDAGRRILLFRGAGAGSGSRPAATGILPQRGDGPGFHNLAVKDKKLAQEPVKIGIIGFAMTGIPPDLLQLHRAFFDRGLKFKLRRGEPGHCLGDHTMQAGERLDNFRRGFIRIFFPGVKNDVELAEQGEEIGMDHGDGFGDEGGERIRHGHCSWRGEKVR